MPDSAAGARTDQGAICTLGMHRSGTSLVSRILNILGVYLGASESVAGAGIDNPKGYWEHNRLALVNDEILARFGGRWDEPPALPAGWPRDPRLTDLRERAGQIVANDLAVAPLWGWKDPRTCLTLPFWQDLIGPMRYVICLRNPCAVTASLGRRNAMPAEKAEGLWLAHVHASLSHTSGHPRLFVFYDDLMNDWAPEVRRLASFIGRPLDADDPHVIEAAADFLETALCHHRMSLEDLAADPTISFATKSLYLALRGHAPRDTTSGATWSRNHHAQIVQRALDLHASQAVEVVARTTELGAERAALVQESHARAATIAGLQAERDALVQESHRRAADIAGLQTERDALVQEGHAHAHTHAVFGAERDRLLDEARSRADAIVALEQAHEAVLQELREYRAGSALSFATLSRSALDALGAERDRTDARARVHAEQVSALEAERAAALGALQAIHGSLGWRFVSSSGRVINALLPVGTRRRSVLRSMLGYLSRRRPSSGARETIVDRGAG